MEVERPTIFGCLWQWHTTKLPWNPQWQKYNFKKSGGAMSPFCLSRALDMHHFTKYIILQINHSELSQTSKMEFFTKSYFSWKRAPLSMVDWVLNTAVNSTLQSNCYDFIDTNSPFQAHKWRDWFFQEQLLISY